MTEFVSFPSVSAQERILKAAGAQGSRWGDWWLDGKLVGYREEIDRDEDRMYFDYFVRKDLT
jgi:hypothetical protein